MAAARASYGSYAKPPSGAAPAGWTGSPRAAAATCAVSVLLLSAVFLAPPPASSDGRAGAPAAAASTSDLDLCGYCTAHRGEAHCALCGAAGARALALRVSNRHERAAGRALGDGLYPYAHLVEIHEPTRLELVAGGGGDGGGAGGAGAGARRDDDAAVALALSDDEKRLFAKRVVLATDWAVEAGLRHGKAVIDRCRVCARARASLPKARVCLAP